MTNPNNESRMLSIAGEKEMWGLIRDQSDILFKSQCLPSNFANMAQVMAVIQFGRELGYAPMTALNNIILVKGKPSMSANMIAAKLKQSGYKIKVKKLTDKVCTLSFTSPDGDVNTFSFTWEDAQRAKLTGKDNWMNYPKQMLYARAVSMGGRMFASDVLMGIYATEEMEDAPERVQAQAEVVEDKPVVQEVSTPEVPQEPKVEQAEVVEVAEVKEETVNPAEVTAETVQVQDLGVQYLNAMKKNIENSTARTINGIQKKLQKMTPNAMVTQDSINELLALIDKKILTFNK